MKAILEKLLASVDLTREEARELMRLMLDTDTSEVNISAALTALRVKGETPEELAGCTEALLEVAHRVDNIARPCVDTCGTGGDNSGTFNISTATALLCAAADLNVAKHGNRSVSSQSGSADVIEALGIPFCEPDNLNSTSRFRFFFAPSYHAAVKRVVPVRQALKTRTIFNLVGPLANPASPEYQLIGVPSSDFLNTMGQSLALLNRKRAFVVHGEPGLDEASPAGPFHILDVTKGELSHTYMSAEQFGLPTCSLNDIQGGDAKHNAGIIEAIFRGEKSPRRDTVVLNTALIFLLVGKAQTQKEAASMAAEVIDSGKAITFLEKQRSTADVA